MAKFSKGDRVRNIEEDIFLEIGDIGTVMTDGDDVPFVLWDGKQWNINDGMYARVEYAMELVE